MNPVFDAYKKLGRALADARCVAAIAHLDDAWLWYYQCKKGTEEQREALEAMQAASERLIEIGRAINLAAGRSPDGGAA